MKRLTLIAVLALVVGLLVFQPRPAQAGTWTMQTDPAEDVTCYFARLYGEVTALEHSCTTWAFVLDTTSHGDPGAAPPSSSGYAYYNGVVEVHNSPFSVNMWTSDLSSYLQADTTYYFRFAAFFAAPHNEWDYGNELTFETAPAPEEDCHHFSGYDPLSYTCVYTDDVAYDDWGHVTFYGHVDDPWYGIESGGWVFDTQSHDNPDGWPWYYDDVPPEESEYPNYLAGPYEGSDQTNWVQDAFSASLDWGITYYYRFCVDFGTPGDWVYGPEYSFTMPPEPDCTLWDYQSLYTPEEYFDPICPDVWVAQNIPWYWYSYTHDFNVVLLKMYRVGTPTEVELYVYLADEFTWYPVGDPVASATIDVSGLTTDAAGEWVEADLSNKVTVDTDEVYDIVLVGADVCTEGGDYAVWVTQYREEGEYDGDYMTSYDGGTEWYWPSRDALFALYCCAGGGSVAGTYETWGYVPSTRPAWYQAWPSILKLCYIGVILLSALFVYRRKPPQQPDYQDMNMPEA